MATPQSTEQRADPCWACGDHPVVDETYAAVGLRRCPRCGLLYAADPDRSEATYDAEYFEEYAEGGAYEGDPAQRRHESRARMRYVRRFASGGRLLEVGAAAGYFLEAAAKAGFEVTGIEPVAPVAERAAQRLGVPVLAGLIEDLDLPSGAFDVVCAWHVVEHIPDPNAQLQRLRDTLRPGGHLLLEVPNVGSVIARREGTEWVRLFPEHHVSQFAPRSLRALLGRAGLEVVDSETVSALSYLRPGRAVRPRSLVAFAKEAAGVRAPSLRHPWKHEMLRAAARRG